MPDFQDLCCWYKLLCGFFRNTTLLPDLEMECSFFQPFVIWLGVLHPMLKESSYSRVLRGVIKDFIELHLLEPK